LRRSHVSRLETISCLQITDWPLSFPLKADISSAACISEYHAIHNSSDRTGCGWADAGPAAADTRGSKAHNIVFAQNQSQSQNQQILRSRCSVSALVSALVALFGRNPVVCWPLHIPAFVCSWGGATPQCIPCLRLCMWRLPAFFSSSFFQQMCCKLRLPRALLIAPLCSLIYQQPLRPPTCIRSLAASLPALSGVPVVFLSLVAAPFGSALVLLSYLSTLSQPSLSSSAEFIPRPSAPACVIRRCFTCGGNVPRHQLRR
jgi:hypothetical protein